MSLNIYFTFVLPSEMLKVSPPILRTGFFQALLYSNIVDTEIIYNNIMNTDM